MIKTAVVILNWNGEVMLRQFLPSVIACSRLEGTEIYVADNASTDASCEVVEKEFPSVRLIRLDKNYGFADGYNYALQKIDAEYVVLLNSDVEVTEGWLQPMVDYLDTHRRLWPVSRKSVRIVTGTCLNMPEQVEALLTVMVTPSVVDAFLRV